MDKLILWLTQRFRVEVGESYYRINSNDRVIYPYLVFTLDAEPLRPNANGFYMNVDIFDNRGNDDQQIEQVTDQLMGRLANEYTLTSDFLAQITFMQSHLIPTGSDVLQRRQMQFYCKIDWRK